MKLNWKNLKNYCCPKCGSSLKKNKAWQKRECANQACGFSIYEDKMKQIRKDYE